MTDAPDFTSPRVALTPQEPPLPANPDLHAENDRLRGEVAALSKRLGKTKDAARRLEAECQRLRDDKELLLIDCNTLRARLAQREEA